MGLTYTIDSEDRIVVLTCGNTSLDAWRRLMNEIIADPRFGMGFGVLVDCRTATKTPSVAEVNAVAGFLSSSRHVLGEGRWAVVVEREAGFGMARMASILTEETSVPLKAFRDIDEALGWLKAGVRS